LKPKLRIASRLFTKQKKKKRVLESQIKPKIIELCTLKSATSSFSKLVQSKILSIEIKLCALKFASPSSELVQSKVVSIEALQRKLDAQTSIIEVFKGLLSISEGEHCQVLEKSTIAIVEWKNNVHQGKVWMRQKLVMTKHFKFIKAGRSRPSFSPSPLPFDPVGY
jgi:hypothetical protein